MGGMLWRLKVQFISVHGVAAMSLRLYILRLATLCSEELQVKSVLFTAIKMFHINHFSIFLKEK